MGYLDELQYHLFDAFEVIIDELAVWRALQRLNWSRKRLQRIARQRNQQLRDGWFAKLSQWRADQLIFLDESAACERTGMSPSGLYRRVRLTTAGDRRYGWSPRGMRAYITQDLRRSKRWSLLPAYTVNGYLEWIIYQGSITAAMFNDFVRDLILPHCGSYTASEPLSVIICDNASVHHNCELAEMCEQAGVRLEYLPPYSPDLNPIETSFATLKAWIKRHQDIAEGYAEAGDFAAFLDMAVRAQAGAGDPGNIFRKSGIYYRSDAEMYMDEDAEEDDACILGLII